MKVIVDNCIALDALKPDVPFEREAREIFRLASEGIMEGRMGANSLTDIFYVLRKEHGAEKAKGMIGRLMRIFDTVGVDAEDCAAALDKPMSDFEDALVCVCAEKIRADRIVTRDKALLAMVSTIRIVSPADLLVELTT